MNLLTPVAGFLIGYSGVMGYEVLKSTHSGEMPGPKSFGYFIGAMTLLSAGTIYALGKKSNVLAAESFGAETDMVELPIKVVAVMDGDWNEHDGKMNIWPDDSWEDYDWEEAIRGCIEEGSYEILDVGDEDWDELDVTWVGHPAWESLKHSYYFPHSDFEAEDTTHALVTGSVEGEPAMFLFSKGESDDTGFTTGRILVDNDGDELRDIAANIHDGVGEDRIRKGFKSWKRNVWGLKPYSAEGNYNDFISDLEAVMKKYGEMIYFDSEFSPSEKRLSVHFDLEVDDEHFDDVVFESEMIVPDQCCICGIAFMGYGHNPEPYLPYAAGRCCDTCNATVVIPMRLSLMGFDAEQSLKGRVRTLSGKPHTPRKLKKDKKITPEEASKKLKFETPQNAYNLAYNQGFDDGRSQRRVTRTVYSPDTAYMEDEKLFDETYRRTK